jgi:hypothetical protein
MFNEILNSYDLTAEHRGLIEKTIEQLEKKSAHNGDKKPTATQLENEKIKDRLIDFLTENSDNQFTISDVQKVAEFSEYSNQKLSALLNKLVSDKVVEKAVIKRKAYFSITKTEW